MYLPFFYDMRSMIFLIPAIILAVYAQSKVKNTFEKYLKVRSMRDYTGAEAAEEILRRNHIYDVEINVIPGQLTDHYNPKNKTLNLSKEVYYGTSVASIGVAAHEAGHAIQHELGYIPIIIRGKLVPIANIGSTLAWPLVIIGLLMGSFTPLINLGIYLFVGAVAFHLVTLPVEFNASSRAVEALEVSGVLAREEIKPTKKVLNAAALTYVASAAVAVAQLLRLIFISRRD